MVVAAEHSLSGREGGFIGGWVWVCRQGSCVCCCSCHRGVGRVVRCLILSGSCCLRCGAWCGTLAPLRGSPDTRLSLVAGPTPVESSCAPMAVQVAGPSPRLGWSSACHRWTAGGVCVCGAAACRGWEGCWGRGLRLNPVAGGSVPCRGRRAGCPPAGVWCVRLKTCTSDCLCAWRWHWRSNSSGSAPDLHMAGAADRMLCH